MGKHKGGTRPEGGYQPAAAQASKPPQGGSGTTPAAPAIAEAVAHGQTVPIEGAVQATVTRATAPPRKKVFMCFGHPGITREASAEDVALQGPPFCTQCGIRMAEDITGRL